MYNPNDHYQKKMPDNNMIPLYGKVNGRLQIKLKENQTTGYCWAVAQLPPNICLYDSYYTPDPAPPYYMGTGGTRTIDFGGLSAGRGYLKLIKVQPWDLMNPVDAVVYDVVIQP